MDLCGGKFLAYKKNNEQLTNDGIEKGLPPLVE
jgi:hypothetical protein